MTELRRELESLGLAPRRLVLLDAPGPTNVDYLDLVPEPTSAAPDVCIEVVLPGLHGPTLYLVREDRLALAQAGASSLVPLLHKLACRGEDALLAVFKPGLVDVYPVGFSNQGPLAQVYPRTFEGLRPLFVDLEAGDSVAVHGGTQQESAHRAVHALLFSLIQEVTQQLRKTRSLRDKPDVLFALVGRALFARFLVDRKIMTVEHGPKLPSGVGLVDCFSTPQAAARTCKWLDTVFNGDLLPLWGGSYTLGFQQLHEASPKALGVLSNLVRREPNGQMTFDDLWADLDFGHIPVGLLSEVYERYAHDVFPDHATSESVHYTPRGIARLMVNEAFDGLGMDDPGRARVLDPAAGAGVFLVLAYRRLVTERWRRIGRRPSSEELRKILAEQVCGLDINTYALKLAALSLYLTVLEFDPPDEPSARLSFDPLLGSVLRPTRAVGEEFPCPYPVAGSLGSEVPRTFDGSFDLVIGNPPWTSWSPGNSRKSQGAVARLNVIATEITRRIATQRLPQGQHEEFNGYKNPDNIPDLPFIWRAMEWARPGGTISLVVHARLLFKRSNAGTAARNLLFRCLRFTAIVNGSDLAGTRVWPSVNVPFAILFAKNEAPKWPDGFYFISPYRDLRPAAGRVRVDAHDAMLVQQQLVAERPQVLKTLYRGGGLDSEIMQRIEALGYPTLKEYWERTLGLRSGKGLQTASNLQSARELLGLPYLTTKFDGRFIVDAVELPRFRTPRVHRIRDPLIYRGPIVVFREAVLEDQTRRALLCFESCVFNESFIGYSAHGSGEAAKDLTAYLLVLGLSNFPLYYSLMTSAKFGVTRKVFQAEDLDALPIKPLAEFTDAERHTFQKLAHSLRAGRCEAQTIDRFVFGLYGLSEVDREVIRDTLATRAPYGSAHEFAAAPPTQQRLEGFAHRLESVLQPFFTSTQDCVAVSHVPGSQTAWHFLRVAMNNMAAGGELPTGMLTALGEASGASVVRYVASPGDVYLAILAQGRYWTPTRARTLAISLLRSGETLFPITPLDDLKVSAG